MDYSIQLYSARKFPPLDPALGRFAGLGYKQVEGYGALYGDIEALRASLDRHGLRMPTAHIGLDQLRDVAGTLRIAEKLGIRVVYVPHLAAADRGTEEARWLALAEELSRLGEAYRREGVGFGWHNHDFEFKPLSNGRLPMEVLLEAAPFNDWEIDVAWVVRGGQDPAAWIRKYGRQISAIHVKDLAPAGEMAEDGWADPGHGTIDWVELFSVIKASTGARYYVVEHDNPVDVDRFAHRAIEFLKRIGA